MTIEKLLHDVDNLVSNEVKLELRAQGHYNTGKLDQSIAGAITTNGDKSELVGTAAYYALILHHGFGAEKASFKQFPFLVRYFMSKGHAEKDAKAYAAMTIRKWMKEGMPTAGSQAYSETGNRLHVISIVQKVVSPKINTIMHTGIDKIVNNKFHETKAETI